MSEVTDNDLYALYRNAFSLTMEHLSHRSKTDEVARAELFLVCRVANTWRTVETLRRALLNDSPETFMVDAGTLVRAAFEAYMQAAYIGHDPKLRGERANLYLDYLHVERKQEISTLFKYDTFLSRRLRNSPRRAAGEKAVEEQYARVKTKYLTGKGDKLRKKWYPGTLADLARAIGMEADYDHFITMFHGFVHSSAYALQHGPPISPKDVTTHFSGIASRTMKIALDCMGIRLPDTYQSVIEASAQPLFPVEDATDVGRGQESEPQAERNA